MKKVIFDCDNTMGIKNRDIDDGLALLYLINNLDVELKGVTCTYGNDRLDKVFTQTVKLIDDLSLEIPVFKGNGNYDMIDYVKCEFKTEETKNYLDNDAAKFIVEMVNRYPNEISILATGSLQNLYDAWQIDKSIVEKIKEVVVMGGITEPLYFNNKVMNELNFSVCSRAAECVINEFKNLSILTGNSCMEIEFTQSDLKEIENIGEFKNKFVFEKLCVWMDEFKEMYGYDSIVLWDVIAAIYLTDSDLFKDNTTYINSTLEDLNTGKLVLVDNSLGIKINIPSAKNSSQVNKKLIEVVFK
ncbi:nucleoside hydrolase [Peptoniphilus indolicus]|nr:nucleoside hydrolase [Peptoniphilus indolicus]SUB75155.1 Pyrimidine-specific ribonucleoside hydrolase rihB [Peptoniphilus indolicus]